MGNINKNPDFLRMKDTIMKGLIIEVEKTGMDFIHANFKEEGFYDRSYEVWQKRKNEISYALLSVTNNLFRSISATNDGKSKVIFSSDMPYAQIHNEGGYIKQRFKPTKKMKKFFWALYKKTNEEKYKYMAFAKEINRTIYIPKRQFMGDSFQFSGMIDSIAINRILTGFNNKKTK